MSSPKIHRSIEPEMEVSDSTTLLQLHCGDRLQASDAQKDVKAKTVDR